MFLVIGAVGVQLAHAAVPEPSAVVFGFGTTSLPLGTLVEARVGAEQVASYTTGSIPEAGPSYILEIPLEVPTEVAEPRTAGVARPGDVVELFVNGVSTGSTLALDQRGIVVRLDLDAGDVFPPTPPSSLSSTSHTLDEWIANDSVDLLWSGATDGQGALAGYSILSDNSPLSEPDLSIDVPQTADPHSFSVGPLADADNHFFHLRACDLAGSCSPSIHLGPFKIDTTAPGAPVDLVRTSADDAPSLEVAWTAATDASSGIAGYGYEFSLEDQAACGEELSATETTAISDPLEDGDWYLHVCAVDAAGNWGEVETGGPYGVQASPPQITAVSAVGPTQDGLVEYEDLLGNPVTQLVLQFNEQMSDPGGNNGPDDVTNPANYLLVAAGDDGTVETQDCSAGAAPEDAMIVIDTASYNQAEMVVPLRLDAPRGLEPGLHRLLACGSIGLQDTAGSPLDGDGDGTGGDDFAIDFEVLFENFLDNPNFDEGTDSWDFVGNSSAALFASNEDVGGAATSGSAEVTGVASGAQVWTSGQCLAVPSDTDFQLSGSVLIDSGAAEPTAALVAEIHRDADCTVLMGRVSVAEIVGDTDGEFEAFSAGFVSTGPALGGEAFVKVQLEVSTEFSAGFTVLFDTISFHDPKVIFRNGFETGDTTEWSASQGEALP